MITPEFEVRNDDSDSFHNGKVKVTIWTDWEGAKRLVEEAQDYIDSKPDPILEMLKKATSPGKLFTYAQSAFDDPIDYAQNETT